PVCPPHGAKVIIAEGVAPVVGGEIHESDQRSPSAADHRLFKKNPQATVERSHTRLGHSFLPTQARTAGQPVSCILAARHYVIKGGRRPTSHPGSLAKC